MGRENRHPSPPLSLLRSNPRILLAIVLTVIVFSVFSPCLSSGFINWDDPDYVTENPAIRDLSFAGMKRLSTGTFVGTYVPLTMMSFAVEHRLAGLNPFVYHATNLILHVGNCLLVFSLAYALSRSVTAGLLTALFFGVHPLRVESVAWISERKDVLYGFFFLAGLLTYIRWRACERRAWYWGTLGCCVLSLLAKPAAVSFPLALLCLAYAQRGRIEKRDIVPTAPFFILALGFAAGTLLSQQGAIRHEIPAPVSLLLAGNSLLFYLAKTLVPARLACLYPRQVGLGIAASPLVAPFALAALTALMALWRRDRRTVQFGSLFFLATILPMLQVVPVGVAVAADRYTYLPSVGLAYIAAQGFAALMARRGRCAAAARNATVAFLAIAVLLLASLTWRRCGVWRDSITLWSDEIAKYPRVPRAYSLRGLAYFNAGEYDRAMTDFDKAILLDPGHAQEYYMRGLLHEKRDDIDKALLDFTEAVRRKSGYAKAHHARGLIYARRGDRDPAIRDFTAAIRSDGSFVYAYAHRAFMYYQERRYREAWDDVRAIEKLGFPVDPAFLADLAKASRSGE